MEWLGTNHHLMFLFNGRYVFIPRRRKESFRNTTIVILFYFFFYSISVLFILYNKNSLNVTNRLFIVFISINILALALLFISQLRFSNQFSDCLCNDFLVFNKITIETNRFHVLKKIINQTKTKTVILKLNFKRQAISFHFSL